MTSASGQPKRILVVNQHGDNRGDEAALDGMVTALTERLGDCAFTIIHQYRSKAPNPRLGAPVVWLPMRMPLIEALRVSAYALLRRTGVRWMPLAGTLGRRIANAYETADVVVSAPGGPYFGDLYADHELVHWFYVWLAGVHGKRIVLYSPSAGPFENRVLNPIRRRLYSRFVFPLTARESVSGDHLRALLGPEVPILLTADSALQVRVRAGDRAAFEAGSESRGKTMVAVAANNYDYPELGEPEAPRERHDRCICSALEALNEQRPIHVVLFPQLYGPGKEDAGYLEQLGRRLSAELTWELVDPGLGSREQRSLVAMADVCIAGRYHPLVFATSAGVPALTIYYEHKALGLARDVGLERYAFDIRDIGRGEVEDGAMARALAELVAARSDLSMRILERERELRKRALRVNDSVVAALRSTSVS